MRFKILKNIDRLSLHDSRIEKVVKDGDNLIIVMDWAKLEDYREQGIKEGIIIGKCELIFIGLNNENLKLDFSGTIDNKNMESKEIDFCPEIFNDWLILENKMESKNKFILSGFIDYKEKSGWLNWQFSFTDFSLNWSSFITLDDWKNGKIIEDK